MRNPGVRNWITRFVLLSVLDTIWSCRAFSASTIFGRTAHKRVGGPLRRASQNETAPPPFSFAPSQYWDGNDGPWSSFAIQVGSGSVSGAQQIRVFPSTVSSNVWTIGAQGCPPDYVPDCDTNRGFRFFPNHSLTWTPNPVSVYELGQEQNLGMNTNGVVGWDVVTLGWPGSGGPPATYSHTVIYNMISSIYWIGEFGLSPRPTNFTTFNNPQVSFLSALWENGTIPSRSYGYTAGNQYQLDNLKIFGSLTLGGYDANRFVPNSFTFQMGEDIQREFLVNLYSITSDKTLGDATQYLLSETISILIDSTVSELWLPVSVCQAFEQAFGLNYTDGHYIVSAAQRQTLQNLNPTVTFTLGPTTGSGQKGVEITLPYGAFDLQIQYPAIQFANSSYYFPLQRAQNSTQYTLGRTFLQEAYLIADYERNNFSVSQCNWDQSQINSQSLQTILVANETSNHGHSSGTSSFSTGDIIGVAVGVAGAVLLLGLILFFFTRRRRKEKRRIAELEAKEANGGAAKEDNASNNEGKPFIPRSELGGGDIHELTAPHKPPAQEMESPLHSTHELGSDEYFKSGRTHAFEMPGSAMPMYEMQGSDVSELPTPERGTPTRWRKR